MAHKYKYKQQGQILLVIPILPLLYNIFLSNFLTIEIQFYVESGEKIKPKMIFCYSIPLIHSH